MKILFSIPSGYHLRELVMPLSDQLGSDQTIEVICLTPAAQYKQLFSQYPTHWQFIANPGDVASHRQLFNNLRPDLIVTDTVGHDEHDYPILKAGKELGIKTLTFIASWDNVWKIDRLIKSGRPVAVADHFIVWNEMMKTHLQTTFNELKPDQILVIGAPRLDYFHKSENIPTKTQLYHRLGLTDIDRPLIHFATTELYPMDYIVRAIRDAAGSGKIKSRPYLYASVHPGGNIDRHQRLVDLGVQVKYSFGRQDSSPHPAFAYNPSQEDIYMLVALFKYADVLINHSSSTALESLIANTPVVNVKYGKPLDWLRWYRSMVYRDFGEHYIDLVADGATAVVTNKEQLVNATIAALKNGHHGSAASNKTIKRMITTTDGTAGQKIIDLIKKLASQS